MLLRKSQTALTVQLQISTRERSIRIFKSCARSEKTCYAGPESRALVPGSLAPQTQGRSTSERVRLALAARPDGTGVRAPTRAAPRSRRAVDAQLSSASGLCTRPLHVRCGPSSQPVRAATPALSLRKFYAPQGHSMYSTGMRGDENARWGSDAQLARPDSHPALLARPRDLNLSL
jgi:hypothetical protein